jgi:hypothetical protein
LDSASPPIRLGVQDHVKEPEPCLKQIQRFL